jgi:hypothetical protein
MWKEILGEGQLFCPFSIFAFTGVVTNTSGSGASFFLPLISMGTIPVITMESFHYDRANEKYLHSISFSILDYFEMKKQ